MQRLCSMAPAALAFLGMAAAQSIPPNQMHARTVPYVPPPPVTLRTHVDVVEVPVVVRDGQHRAIAGLTRDDFEIYDAGRKQEIAGFSVERFSSPGDTNGGTKPVAPADTAGPNDQPRARFVALLFDNLNTGQDALKSAKDAAERFVRTSLAPGDRVAVATTAQSQNLEFTGDAGTLAERIANVTTRQRFSDDSAPQCLPIAPYDAYLIANHLDAGVLRTKAIEMENCERRPDAHAPEKVTLLSMAIWYRALSNSKDTLHAVEGLVGAMAKLPGQRMILLASAGFLTCTLESEEELLMARALHAEVVINTLDARGLFNPIAGSDASEEVEAPIIGRSSDLRQAQAMDDGMAVLAAATGGTFYHNSNDLAHGFRKLGMVPDPMYVLRFSPSGVVADGSFHNLKVKLGAGKRYSVQARPGYTAPSANAAQASPPARLDSEAMASDTFSDLPAGFSWKQTEAREISLFTHLDIGRLKFDTNQDRRTQKLTIVAVLLNGGGNFVTGKRSELELSFTEATYAQLVKNGMNIGIKIEAPPGSYSARAVVLDSVEGKMTAAGAAVVVE